MLPLTFSDTIAEGFARIYSQAMATGSAIILLRAAHVAVTDRPSVIRQRRLTAELGLVDAFLLPFS